MPRGLAHSALLGGPGVLEGAEMARPGQQPGRRGGGGGGGQVMRMLMGESKCHGCSVSGNGYRQALCHHHHHNLLVRLLLVPHLYHHYHRRHHHHHHRHHHHHHHHQHHHYQYPGHHPNHPSISEAAEGGKSSQHTDRRLGVLQPAATSTSTEPSGLWMAVHAEEGAVTQPRRPGPGWRGEGPQQTSAHAFEGAALRSWRKDQRRREAAAAAAAALQRGGHQEH